MVVTLTHKDRACRTTPYVRLVLIVGSTSQLDILDDCSSSIPERQYVMELEKAALSAATLCAHERALSSISCPHGTSYCSRYVP